MNNVSFLYTLETFQELQTRARTRFGLSRGPYRAVPYTVWVVTTLRPSRAVFIYEKSCIYVYHRLLYAVIN